MTEFDLGKVTGDDGKGIVSIELISTSGKNKTYRITFTDESYFDYTVKDGDDALNDIVTAWETTLSDSKVPSEKLAKDTLDTKVDKVAGKGLSTEDYTTVEKSKLAGIEAGANRTVVDSSLSSTSKNPVQNKIIKSAIDYKVNISDIVDNLTTDDSTKPLSAKQGKILKDLIDSLLPTVASVTLSTDKSVLSAYDSDSATLTATALNSQSQPVEGVTVTFYKGSTVLGTATTNSSGVASLTYNSAGAGVLSVTATAEDVTSSSVTLEDCYRYDDCTSDKSSTYSPIQLDTRDVVPSFSFSTDHYILSSSKDCFTGFIPYDIDDGVEVSVDFKLSYNSVYVQNLVGFFDGDTIYSVRARGDMKVDYYTRRYNDGQEIYSTFYTHTRGFLAEYNRLKMVKDGTNLTVSIEDSEGTELASTTETITYSANDKIFFGFLSGNRRDVYIKNIKVLKI